MMQYSIAPTSRR